MMVLKHGDTGRTAALQKVAAMRRKRSKGTIVAYGNRNENNSPEVRNNESPEAQSSAAGSSGAIAAATMTSQPQHSVDSASGPAKPCHSARLALMCVQNALRMGSRTQLYLCPPGRVRRELQATLRQNARVNPASRIGNDTGGGYYSVEKLVGTETLAQYDARDEEFLLSANTFDEDSDEDASSGDEDAMCNFDDLFSEEPPELDDQERYFSIREPLFVSAGSESALSSVGGGPMSSMGSGSVGKLPFNRRKIRYFDSITAADAAFARSYIKEELQRSKKRAALMLSRHLRKVQIEERRRRRIERGEATDDLKDADRETPEESALLNGAVKPFQQPMTPSAAAALILESLAANPAESVEGMAKCYDGIVAAGMALLDGQSDSASLSGNNANESKSRTSRSEIMAALAPLLISSLEQPSGEVILMLAKLRRMCGTPRYQRRFVQRVAPALIRPPRSAMWCLRHQNEMEAILAATELIFDSAFDIFSKGWYERGRLMLADSKRAETLNSVAKQLRNLSSEVADNSIALGFPAHGNRRRLMASGRKGDTGSSNEYLAEWEVIAVDRQIRISISSVLSQDWSRTAIHSDIPKPHNRRATVTSGAKRVAVPEMSPKAMASPRSPNRTMYKTPQSPPHMNLSTTSANAAENIENVFGPAFTNAAGNISDRERALSPPPPNLLPTSPPPVQRSNSKEMDTSKTPMTPPRSPKSPVRAPVSLDGVRMAEVPPSVLAPLSPKRGKSQGPPPKEVVGSSLPSQLLTTPLSPSASSVGTTGSGELITYKPTLSGASSASVVSSTAAHYRMLTSTAQERKRTVAACRALRAQIQRFEEAFIQVNGRPPKGASERAPLATTYAQYREWKRAIRADAACRIQALFRGASTRWRLLRLNNAQVTRVIMTRAGRSKGAENIINQISIPVEIGQAEHERSPTMVLSPSAAPEAFVAPGQTLAPQWASKIVRRRNSSDRDSLPTATAAAVPKQYPPAPSSPTPASSSDLNSLSLADLQARKRDLKQQLKHYDMNFARKHGRMPVKAEKEPIRHLYEAYNALKSQINQMEQDGRLMSTSPAHSPITNSAPAAPPRNASPPTSSEGHSGSEESPSRSSPIPTRGKHKLPKAQAPPIVAPALTPQPDLAALKAEKTQLHQMLRAYEKDFFREHRRQVSSFNDIKPVASQYRRYKEIKKAIAAYQQGDRG